MPSIPEFENPLCAEVDPELFFVPEINRASWSQLQLQQAKQLCFRCEHRVECADYAVNNMVLGIWGGLSEYERRLIRKERGIVAKDISSTPILSGIREIKKRDIA